MPTHLSSRRQIERVLPSAAELLKAKNELKPFHVLQNSDFEIINTDFDNWNGGTQIWTVYLKVDIPYFVEVEEQKSCIETQIESAIDTFSDIDATIRVRVEIKPKSLSDDKSKNFSNDISPSVRQNIFFEYSARGWIYHGEMNELDFISKIFDIDKIPSINERYSSLTEEVIQHCVRNLDYPSDWVFNDDRFNLLKCSKDIFFNFITLSLHPIVRRDTSTQELMINVINSHLAQDGWELVEETMINHAPTFVPERRFRRLGLLEERAQEQASRLGVMNVFDAIDRLRRVGDSDPAISIGLAKDAIEACCKYILHETAETKNSNQNLKDLISRTRSKLKIMPTDIPEDAKGSKQIRQILDSLGKLCDNLVEVRNLYGAGHGRGPSFRGLQPRHARLASGCAMILTEYFLDRHSITLNDEQETEKRD